MERFWKRSKKTAFSKNIGRFFPETLNIFVQDGNNWTKRKSSISDF
jgi:hypothetical protein